MVEYAKPAAPVAPSPAVNASDALRKLRRVIRDDDSGFGSVSVKEVSFVGLLVTRQVIMYYTAQLYFPYASNNVAIRPMI